jgi:hypothetical protein
MTSSSATPPIQDSGARCVFTICTKSYVGLAEALGASLRDNGYAANFLIFVVDQDVSDVVSKFGTLVQAEAFCGFEQPEWREQTFKYDLVEFCTSLKARCFLRLLDSGYENIVYFDPDILVFDDLEQIFTKLETHEVVVTPHRLDIDHDIPSRGGLFNLGFLAVRQSPTNHCMLQWWDDRLMDHSISDATRGFFTDQKWMDNLTLMIPTHQLAVMDHPGMNLGPWNLHEREIKQEGGKALVRLRSTPDDWRPVSFVHFSSLNYGELASGVIGAKAAEFCDRTTGFEDLIEHYKERLKQSRFSEFQDIPYEFATYSDGLPIHPGHRRMYARLQAEGHPAQDPFDTQGTFYQALRARRMLVKRNAVKTTSSGAGGMQAVGRVVLVLDMFSRLSILALGYDRYYLLSKFLTRYLHPVNHARLIGGKGSALDVEYF